MNETQHYCEAENWLRKAKADYNEHGICDLVWMELKFAEVHAQLSVAADVDREADAEARIASCVPDGGSRMQIAAGR